jgi:DNA repair exonuclease SbcCD ATPase subunit
MNITAKHTCSTCKVDKDVSSFSKNKSRANGLHNQCKDCNKTQYLKNAESRKQTMREYDKANASVRNLKAKTYQQDGRARWWDIKKKYDITKEQYEMMLTKQNHQCYICGVKHTDKHRKRLFIDHNHENGKIRGLLCQSCNTGLGHFRDNPILLEQAINYLKDTL